MEVDVISQLPESVIHHILSFLKTKEAARTSTICKAWYAAWFKCPTLDFGESFIDDYTFTYDWKYLPRFLKFIRRIFLRYQKQKICIAQLTLPLVMMNFPVPTLFVDEWVGIAVQNGVTRLELYSPIEYSQWPIAVPRSIFQANTLKELIVRGANLVLMKQVGDEVMFKYLKRLTFSSIYLDDDMFQGIITRCRLIETLCISNCRGLEGIKVTTHYNLKEFTLLARWNPSYAEIDAPNLQYLDCDFGYVHGILGLHKAENLKYLSLFGILVSAIDINDFPRVEELRLVFCPGLERINLSSLSLKRLKLSIKDVKQLAEVKIDAPGIVSFEYNHEDFEFFPELSVFNAPSQWVSKINIWDIRRMGTSEFCKLRGFLAKLINSKISLGLCFHPQCRIDSVRSHIPISRLQQAVEIEDLQLSLEFIKTMRRPNFLDDLFMTFHPKTITMGRYDQAFGFFHENLMARRNQDLLTCHGTKSDLQEVRFEIYDEIKREWRLSNWKRMLEAPQHWERVRYRLEW